MRRTDLIALFCFSFAVYCAIERTWPVVAIAALWAGVLAGLAPEMTGEWVLRALGGEARGTLRDPGEVRAHPTGPNGPARRDREGS